MSAGVVTAGVSPAAQLALARIRSLTLAHPCTSLAGWRSLLQQYWCSSQWSTPPDDATFAVMLDDWDCMHVLQLEDNVEARPPTELRRGPWLPSTCGATPTRPGGSGSTSSSGPRPGPEGMWAVPDALMPTAFRHFLRAGGRVGLIDVGDVWLAPCPPQSVPKDSELCLHTRWLHDAGLVLTPVLPQHADTILGHWGYTRPSSMAKLLFDAAHFPSACLTPKTGGPPVAWAMVHEDGSVGMVRVDDAFRGRGLATKLVSHLVAAHGRTVALADTCAPRTHCAIADQPSNGSLMQYLHDVAALPHHPYAFIDRGNVASQRTFFKLGFRAAPTGAHFLFAKGSYLWERPPGGVSGTSARMGSHPSLHLAPICSAHDVGQLLSLSDAWPRLCGSRGGSHSNSYVPRPYGAGGTWWGLFSDYQYPGGSGSGSGSLCAAMHLSLDDPAQKEATSLCSVIDSCSHGRVPGRVKVVNHVVVAPDARGQGLAGQLLRAALCEAVYFGCDAVWVRLPPVATAGNWIAKALNGHGYQVPGVSAGGDQGAWLPGPLSATLGAAMVRRLEW